MKTIYIIMLALVISLGVASARQDEKHVELSTPVQAKSQSDSGDKVSLQEPVQAPVVAPSDPAWVVSTPIHGVAPEHINNALAVYKSIGLSKEGAAFLVGNFAQESPSAFINPCERYGDGGLALGFGQWHPGRRADMPCTVNEQLIWAVNVEMPRDAQGMGYTPLNERLKGNDIADIRRGLQQWERYGYEGTRYQHGQNIYDQIK